MDNILKENEKIKEEILKKVKPGQLIVNFKFIITNSFKNKITYKVSNKTVYIKYFKDRITTFLIYNNLIIYIKKSWYKIIYLILQQPLLLWINLFV